MQELMKKVSLSKEEFEEVTKEMNALLEKYEASIEVESNIRLFKVVPVKEDEQSGGEQPESTPTSDGTEPEEKTQEEEVQ